MSSWLTSEPMRSRGVRRPSSSSSSVSRARFVTAEGLELKLGTHDPLGKNSYHTKFRSDLIPGLATRGQKAKSQKVELHLNKRLDSCQIFTVGISK